MVISLTNKSLDTFIPDSLSYLFTNFIEFHVKE